MRSDEQELTVSAKAVLLEAAGSTVVWMNEAAARDAGEDAAPGTPAERALPLPASLGLPEALREVARTGVARHLRADLVSTAKGRLAIVVSVYRVPGDMLLVLSDNTFQAKPRSAEGGEAGARPRRRGR